MFQVYNEVSGELQDSSGLSFGTYQLDKNRNVTMIFNENIEGRFNVKGTLEFRTMIREDLSGDLDQTIVIDIVDNDVVRIPISFESNIKTTIDKRGVPNRTYNAETIQWQVDFNKSLDTISNAVLSDPIQAGQIVDIDSIRLYELQIDLGGNVTVGNEVHPGRYEISGDETGFDLIFNEPIDSAYRLEFETIITDDDQQNFGNKATLKGNEINDLPAEAWVWTGRGQPLEKRAVDYDGTTQTITWEIKLNYNERSLSKEQSVVSDWFSNTHKFVDGSLNVYEVEIDENGHESSLSEVSESAYQFITTSREGANGFELQFNQGIDRAYKVTYQTQSIDRVFDYEHISNTVEFNDDSKTVDREIWQHILGKWHENVDYKNKTVDWYIVVNEDGYEMNSLILTDTFSNKGLTMIDGSLTIDDLDESYYEVIYGEDGFQIRFKDTINEKIVIRYTTKFDYEKRKDKDKNYFLNDVHLEWKDENNEKNETDGSFRFEPDHFTQTNGFKGGSYNAITKEITWTIGVNYNLREIENAKVIDYILGNQALVEDSIKVYPGRMQGGQNQFDRGETPLSQDEYSIELVTDSEENPGFSIDLGSINSAYIIEYKTTLEDQLIEQTYKNTAYLFDGTDKLAELDASVSVHDGGTYTKKRGQQDGRVVNWEIEINSGQSTLSNVVLTDVPTPNQVIMQDSFVLYPTNVAENGHLTINEDEPLVEGVDYQLEFLINDDDVEYFTVSFNDSIDRAFVLRYQTFIMAGNGEYVANNAKLTGSENIPTDTDTSERVQVRITEGIGTGSGETGQLTIKKTDADGLLLEGATFALYDETEAILIRTGETDENGELTFKNILYGNYVVKELEAPDGICFVMSQNL